MLPCVRHRDEVGQANARTQVDVNRSTGIGLQVVPAENLGINTLSNVSANVITNGGSILKGAAWTSGRCYQQQQQQQPARFPCKSDREFEAGYSDTCFLLLQISIYFIQHIFDVILMNIQSARTGYI